MNITKPAMKRKINDDPAVELTKASKVRRVEKRNNSTKGADSSLIFNTEEHITTGKQRQKISSILHYEKKYKYYCKKHNVIYLVEKSRRKSKEYSKQSRDNLVNSFRTLDLTKNVPVKAHLGNYQQSEELLPKTEHKFTDDDGDQESDTEISKCRVSRIFVISDENVNCFAQCQKNTKYMSNHQSPPILSWRQLTHSFNDDSDESEENDSDEGYNEDYYLKGEVLEDEDFILTRSPRGTSIIMKKIENSSYVNDYENCCALWNCFNSNYFDNNLYDFDSSFNQNEN